MEKWAKIALFSTTWVLLLLDFCIAQAPSDNRCYLENGASSESFFVSEDIPIGSTIGQIKLHGDPRPGGNIALRLKEADSPVHISPGTNNLTLRRKLDKEGIDGPSSVFVNLICERLRTSDPGFVIPISIRVTDANDNAPHFVNAPYILNISEVTVIGTRVLQGVHAIDNDQQGPFSTVRYSVLPGPHSDYFEFENELEGTLVLRKTLDYETLHEFDVHIRAQDHGEPPKGTDTVLTVHVVDADDQNPKFFDDRYTVNITSLMKKGSTLSVSPRHVKAYDQDLGINSTVFYTFNGAGQDYNLFRISKNHARITLTRDIFDSDFAHPATLVIRATQEDNPDRYALATLTVVKNMGNGIRFLHELFYINVRENIPSGSIIATLANNRPGGLLKYYVSDQNVLKNFGINPKGEITLKKQVDYEEKKEFYFKVFATDGITNDSSVVNITVEDVNEWEPRFRYPHYEFYSAGLPNELLGNIEAADGDTNDKITLTLQGNNASSFFMTPTGELRLREGASYGGIASFEIMATDSGNPPKASKVPVTVHFPGNGRSYSGGVSSPSRGSNTTPLLLAGLGAILLISAFVIALLIAYILKGRKRSTRPELPTLQPEKPRSTSPMSPIVNKITNNPMFGGIRSPTATAMGGIPNEGSKIRISSPKIHPAPQPPMWPNHATTSRVKKLSWGDKTDTESIETLNELEAAPKLSENTNLTVYF